MTGVAGVTAERIHASNALAVPRQHAPAQLTTAEWYRRATDAPMTRQ